MEVNADNPGLPRRLARLRNRAGLTRQELADRAGVTFNTINDIEKGRRPHPMEKTLQCIAGVLEVPYEYLAFGEGEVSQGAVADGAERGRGLSRRGVLRGGAGMLLVVIAAGQVHWERTRPPTTFQCVVRSEIAAPGAVALEDVDGDGTVEWIHSSGQRGEWVVFEFDRADPEAWRLVPGPSCTYEDDIQLPAHAFDVNGDGRDDLFNVCVDGDDTRIDVVDVGTGQELVRFEKIPSTMSAGGAVWRADLDIVAVGEEPHFGGPVAVLRANEAGAGGTVQGRDLKTGRELWRYASAVEIKTAAVADVNGCGSGEVFVWGAVQPGSGQEHGSPARAYAAALDAEGSPVWRRPLSERCADVAGCMLRSRTPGMSLVFAAVNAGGRRRAAPSYILLLDAATGARVDSLPYTELIVGNPLVYDAPGDDAWDVYCGTESGGIRRYRVENDHVALAGERWLGRDWAWPARKLAGDAVGEAFIVATADHHSYIVDRELQVLLNRSGVEGSPISPITSFGDPDGGSYVAFLCHGDDVCVDRVVPDSGWRVRKWWATAYLLPLVLVMISAGYPRGIRSAILSD